MPTFLFIAANVPTTHGIQFNHLMPIGHGARASHRHTLVHHGTNKGPRPRSMAFADAG
jgi:hypothetical protein